jgi:hypothetical protein
VDSSKLHEKDGVLFIHFRYVSTDAEQLVTCVLLLLGPFAKLDMEGGGFSGNLHLCVVVCMDSMGLLGMPVDLVLSNCASAFVAKLMAFVKE